MSKEIIIKEHIISLIGGGGKSSIASYLASSFAENGENVVITTTTHISSTEFVEAELGFFEGSVSVLGTPCENGKYSALPDSRLAELVNEAKAGKIRLIIEADGAKRKPFKAPAAHEPVIIPETELVLGVLGADAYGKKLGEVGFRIQELKDLLGREEDELITAEDYVKVYFSENGQQKNLPKCRYIPVLSKTDTDAEKEIYREISELINNKYHGNYSLLAAKNGVLFIL